MCKTRVCTPVLMWSMLRRKPGATTLRDIISDVVILRYSQKLTYTTLAVDCYLARIDIL